MKRGFGLVVLSCEPQSRKSVMFCAGVPSTQLVIHHGFLIFLILVVTPIVLWQFEVNKKRLSGLKDEPAPVKDERRLTDEHVGGGYCTYHRERFLQQPSTFGRSARSLRFLPISSTWYLRVA